MIPKVGLPVQYKSMGMWFPALITHVWSETTVNLFIFPDGSHPKELPGGVTISTSVLHGQEEHQWRFLEEDHGTESTPAER